jgi:hypothetical protein
MTLTLTFSREDCLTTGVTAGAVLTWLGAALCLYGPWLTKNTEWLTLRPMTQNMRYGCLATGEIILLIGGLLLALMYRADPTHIMADVNRADQSLLLGPIIALTLVAVIAAIPVGVIGIGWICVFPSNLSHKVGRAGYAVRTRGRRPLSVVFPEITPRTRWWGGRQWAYYNVP